MPLATFSASVHLKSTHAKQDHREANQPQPQAFQRVTQPQRAHRPGDAERQTACQRC